MKPNRERDEWLNAFPGFRKYLNQCVACQELGYDPVQIELKDGLYFKERAMKYFQPLTLDEIGLCSICAEVVSGHSNDPAGA